MEIVNVEPQPKIRVPLVVSLITLVLLLGAVAAFTILGNNTGGDLLTQNLSEPLGGATTSTRVTAT
jgi:hypothetical protein